MIPITSAASCTGVEIVATLDAPEIVRVLSQRRLDAGLPYWPWALRGENLADPQARH
jgi:hypothetical protein